MQLINQENKPVYSDGQETELRMLKIAQEHPENLSEQYIADCYDYTTNNTFSSVRRNLLNWYSFKEHASVLEIGAGMGALTGLLCDRCEKVTAVEMNSLRADVIRARYSSRKNLTVKVGTLEELELHEKYDYVVFVGVLEYAGIFSKSTDPFTEFLQQAVSYLKEHGKLLFAIENQYGLKYWCGAAEDHIQKPFVGIEGYKEEKTARTFSKAALANMLQQVGLNNQRFYGVLPDYKFPTFIFSEEWKASGSELQNISYTYGKNSALIANEKDIYSDLSQNDVLMFFANSFLVEASVDALEDRHPLLVTARGENKPEYRILTKLYSDGYLIKEAAHLDARQHLQNIFEYENRLADRGIRVLKSEWKNGYLSRRIVDLPRADKELYDRIQAGDIQGIWELIELLRTNLLKSSKLTTTTETALHVAGLASPDEQFGVILQDGYVDMTFYNAFWDQGELVFFDQEWCIPNLPLEFILYYAVKSIFTRAGKKYRITCEDILRYIDISPKRWQQYDQLEEHIWSNVFLRTGDFYGEGGYCTQYHNTNKLSDILQNDEKLREENAQYLADLQCKQGHIEQLLENERNLKCEAAAYAQMVSKYQSEKAELLQQISDKEGHIAQLLESDRELERIKTSRSWRFMGYVWKIRDALIPKDSKRRLLGKMMVKFIKHPIHFLRKCTPTRIGKFFSNLRREGVEGTSRRLDDCLIGTEIQHQKLQIIDMGAIKTTSKTLADYAQLTISQWADPQVSIIIPVYNQFEYTYLCIESIIKNSGEIRYEILIADDCSNDLTADIEQVVSGLRVIRNAENLRFLRNCNNAAKYAKGQYILFLNNDTQVQENWLAPLVELIERDKKIGMVGSKLVYPDGRLQEAGGIIWEDGSAWNYGNRSDPDLPEYNYVKEVDYISGAAIMIRRELWEEIGGFDERFVPAYCEDSDLAFEVRKHGYRVMYQPKSVVVHFEGISNGTDTSGGQKAYQVTNQRKFFEKWKDVLQFNHLPNGVKPFLAREHAVDRKVLLMIDHYVPQFDKDAGSKTVFQYLQLFVAEGFAVKFIGDNFYPHQPYTEALQQMGVEVLYGPYYAKHWKTWLKENGEDIGYAFLNRPHISIKYIDELRKYTKAKIIYYGHDLHFLREKREYDLTKDAALLKSSQEWEGKELHLMRAADMAYYPSFVEVEEIHKIAPDVKVKAIPAYLFADIAPIDYDYEKRRDLMFIGGFGHRPNVDAVVWLANEIMPRLLQLLPDVFVYILGSNPPEEVKKLNSEHLKIMGFVSDQELAEYYHKCRLSIVPLRYGAGIKGKVIEAMRYGMPVMTTSIGAEGIQGAESILEIADDAQVFAEKLAAIYQKPDELCARSKASYRYIQQNFSFENAREVIASEFDLELSK